MALVAVHLGVIDEEQINNMSYIFFEDVLSELGHKLTYDAIVNYAGNSFCEKSWDMITEHHPFYVGEEGSKNSSAMNSLAGFLNKATNVKIGKPKIHTKKGITAKHR